PFAAQQSGSSIGQSWWQMPSAAQPSAQSGSTGEHPLSQFPSATQLGPPTGGALGSCAARYGAIQSMCASVRADASSPEPQASVPYEVAPITYSLPSKVMKLG